MSMVRLFLFLTLGVLLGCWPSDPPRMLPTLGVAQMQRDGEQPIDFLLEGDTLLMQGGFRGRGGGLRLTIAGGAYASTTTIRFYDVQSGIAHAGICFQPLGGARCCAQSGVEIQDGLTWDIHTVQFSGHLKCEEGAARTHRFALSLQVTGCALQEFPRL